MQFTAINIVLKGYFEKLDEVVCCADDLDLNNNSEYKKAFQNIKILKGFFV